MVVLGGWTIENEKKDLEVKLSSRKYA